MLQRRETRAKKTHAVRMNVASAWKTDRMAKLVFTGDGVTAEEIVEKVKQAASLLKLEFLGCVCAADDVIAQLCPHLNQDLLAFTAQNVKVTSNGFKVILERCPILQHLRFISCPNLDSNIISHIGAHCSRLKSLSIEYIEDDSCYWSTDEDVLSLLVKNCSSELCSISFAGFSSVTDIGVNYVAECYFNSLQRVNFNQCCNLTNKGLIGLASSCKYLREVNVASTSISDKGVLVLADKCSRLRQIDLSNCYKLTNRSIIALAVKCHRLEEVCVRSCGKVNEDSLTSLAQHCHILERLDFSGTSVRIVPPLVLGLRKLKSLKLNMCNELSHPPSYVVNKELEGILDFYKEYNVTYRLKVFFMGEPGLGKTSVIQSVVQGSPQRATSSTEGVKSHYWQPLKSAVSGFDSLMDRRVKPEEQQLLLELWDLTGRKVCQGVHQVFLSQDALFVILFDPHDHGSCDRLHSQVKAIQAKAPGSRLLLVGSLSNGVLSVEDQAKRSQEVLQPLLQAERLAVNNIKSSIDSLRKLERDIKVEQKIEGLEYLLHLRPKISHEVVFINYKTGEGLEDVRQRVVAKCLSHRAYHHLGRPITPTSIYILETIIQLRDNGNVIVPWEALLRCPPAGESDNEVEAEIERLHLAGALLDLKFIDIHNTEEHPLRYICIQPAVMAHLICLLHVDNPRKSFKIEARRFWPRDAGCKKPEPSVLVKALEDIPKRGIIREVLLPILWQDIALDEQQVSLMRDVLIRLGLLVQCPCSIMNGLTLPHFPSLSPANGLYLPLMDSLPNNKPQLNWTAQPFKGDIQINWRYTFPNGIPPGFMVSLFAVSRMEHVDAPPLSYQHVWQHGALYRIGEALICIQSEDKKFVDLCCRVNADEYGAEQSSVEYLWAHLSIYVLAAEQFLASWHGLFDEVTLVPLGNPLYNGDVIVNERDFSLMQCLEHAQLHENIKFVDDQRDRELLIDLLIPHDVSQFKDVASWIRHVHSKRDVVFSLLQPDSDDSARASPSSCSRLSPATPTLLKPSLSSSSSKKCLDVKWDLSELLDENTSTPTLEKKTLSRRFTSTDKLPSVLPDISENVKDAPLLSSSPTTVAEDENQNLTKTHSDVETPKVNGHVSSTDSTVSEMSMDSEGSEDKWQQEKWSAEVTSAANLAAARFITSVLASAVAEYIRLEHEDNHKMHGRISSAQVRAARTTADAAVATHEGEMEAAAVAVITSAKGIQTALDTGRYKSVRSTMCSII